MEKLTSKNPENMTQNMLCVLQYTTNDGIMLSVKPEKFDAKIVSHTYTDKGVIVFDRPITVIGDKAFCYCHRLTSVTIPDSVTTIGERAFGWCPSLTSVTIPDSVTTISWEAFWGCDSLTSVTIPDSVTTIGYGAFSSCNSLQEFNGKFASEDGRCLIVDGILKSVASAGLTEYSIPDSVTTIGKWAFYGCKSLTSVTIPDSVMTIGERAFDGCESLTSVIIPDSVTTIGDYAFNCCKRLRSVTIPDSVTTIGKGAFDKCSSLQVFNGKLASEDGRCLIVDGILKSFAPAGLTEYTIPNGVTTIVAGTFSGCKSLTSVTIGDSVTTIGDSAFYFCLSLTSVTIGDSVTTIGNSAFYYCKSLTSVTIPDSVTTIGAGAFSDCKSITSVTIGDSVTTIGKGAFCGCDSLTEFKGKFAEDNGRILVIDGTLIAFAPAGLTEYIIPDSVTTIGDSAFYYCKSLTSVTIGDSVTTIGYCAFAECWLLGNVTIGKNVKEIGEDAFENCNVKDPVIYDSIDATIDTIVCRSQVPPKINCSFNCIEELIVPEGCEEAYANSAWRWYI